MSVSLANLFDLTGRTALVTGAAKGIGEAIAWRLAEAGADVVLADLDDGLAESKAAEFVARGKKARGIACDVSKREDRARAIAFTLSGQQRLDVLVNNAGVFPFSPALATDEALWDRVMNINLKGAFFLTQEVARVMAEKKAGGSIINISSIDGMHPSGGLAHYDASKGGLEMLTRSLALEFATLGIRVNAIAPGGISTPGAADVMASMAEGANPADVQKAFAARIPLRRMGEPDDIARAALFFATPASEYVTGRSLVVDGGFLIA